MRYRLYGLDGRHIKDYVTESSQLLMEGQEIDGPGETLAVVDLYRPEVDSQQNLLFIPVTVRKLKDPQPREDAAKITEMVDEYLEQGIEYKPRWRTNTNR